MDVQTTTVPGVIKSPTISNKRKKEISVPGCLLIQGDSGEVRNTWEMIVCVILSKKVHMNMGPTLNAYRDMVKEITDHPASTNSNYVIHEYNITTNITCIVIRRVNHHVLLM